MGLFSGLFKKTPPPKIKGIFKRLKNGVEESTRHEPRIVAIRLAPLDMQSFNAFDGRESPHFPKKLKDVRVEEGEYSALVLVDNSVIPL